MHACGRRTDQMWGALSSFTQRVKSTAGALLDELVLEEEEDYDGGDIAAAGGSEIDVYKTMLTEVQHEQLIASRKYQELFAEREAELQKWRDKAVTLDPSLADEAEASGKFTQGSVVKVDPRSDEDSSSDGEEDEEADERPAVEVRDAAHQPSPPPLSL